MRRIAIFVPILFLAFLIACNSKPKTASDNNFVVNGKLSNTKKDSVYLAELTTEAIVNIDSCITDENGEFYFNIKPKETGFYVIKLKQDNFVTLLCEKGETIEFTGDARELTNSYNVKGSIGSELIAQINEKTRKSYSRVDSLRDVLQKSQTSPKFLKIKADLDSVFEVIFADQQKYVMNFIDKNSNSLASIIALYQLFGNQQLISPNKENEFTYWVKLDNGLMSKYPNSPHTLDLHKKVSEFKTTMARIKAGAEGLEIGAKAPDIELPTPDGKPIKLSSLKGKVVLLDFWASWCAPCRKESPNLVSLYKKYKDKGFEIYSVSLDKTKEDWVKAIKQDKITWIQVSDLKYWDCVASKLYQVESIPHFVLIDKQGKIVERGLSYERLATLVEKMVKKK